MTTIRPGSRPITLVNIFTVAPERQDELVELLDHATEQVMRQQPGFVSANIHKSLDGTRVANYAQWETREHFEAMLANPEAREHMVGAAAVGDADPVLYEVVSVHERDRSAGGHQ